jgi:hypothetical protein
VSMRRARDSVEWIISREPVYGQRTNTKRTSGSRLIVSVVFRRYVNLQKFLTIYASVVQKANVSVA